MALGGIDLNLLVILQALLEEGNLTRAGMRVGIPQPAVSHALARLRRHYRDELLVRTGNSYVLTPLARSLLPTVQESMQLIGQAFSPENKQPPGTGRTFAIAISDYSIVALGDHLLRRVRDLAPDIAIELAPIAVDMPQSSSGPLQHDLLIGPMGFWSAGPSVVMYRDRFVCVVDPANPKLRGGRLTLADLRTLPHAAAQFLQGEQDPVGSALERAGITPTVALTTTGWLPLMFMIAGTDMVAVVPERLARRVGEAASVAIAEPPFGHVEIAEAAWWHPTRANDPTLAWLRAILGELAASFAAADTPQGQRRSDHEAPLRALRLPAQLPEDPWLRRTL